MNSELFGEGGWKQTARLGLLDFDVAIHSDLPGGVELLDELYAPMRHTGRAEHSLIIGHAFRAGEPGFFTAVDGRVVVRTPAPTVAFAHLVFAANQQAIDRSPNLVRLHASGVASGAQVIAMPGAMGAGKSTLAAGLVVAGMRYVTDEVVAIDPASESVRPYGKPISLGVPPAELDQPAWDPSPDGRRLVGASGLVPAAALGAVVTEPLPLGAVVLPHYVANAVTRIDPVAPVDALAAIATHTFHLDHPGTLAALARLVSGVPCYRLVGGSLRDAVAAVEDVVGTEVASR
ncbi:MAG: hypothetical protein ABJC79_16880 [Acidimicrobiia bacterium]